MEGGDCVLTGEVGDAARHPEHPVPGSRRETETLTGFLQQIAFGPAQPAVTIDLPGGEVAVELAGAMVLAIVRLLDPPTYDFAQCVGIAACPRPGQLSNGLDDAAPATPCDGAMPANGYRARLRSMKPMSVDLEEDWDGKTLSTCAIGEMTRPKRLSSSQWKCMSRRDSAARMRRVLLESICCVRIRNYRPRLARSHRRITHLPVVTRTGLPSRTQCRYWIGKPCARLDAWRAPRCLSA